MGDVFQKFNPNRSNFIVDKKYRFHFIITHATIHAARVIS